METEDDYRRRADALLKAAAETDNLKLRSELIDQAAYWHARAMSAHMAADFPAANDEDGEWQAEA